MVVCASSLRDGCFLALGIGAPLGIVDGGRLSDSVSRNGGMVEVVGQGREKAQKLRTGGDRRISAPTSYSRSLPGDEHGGVSRPFINETASGAGARQRSNRRRWLTETVAPPSSSSARAVVVARLRGHLLSPPFQLPPSHLPLPMLACKTCPLAKPNVRVLLFSARRPFSLSRPGLLAPPSHPAGHVFHSPFPSIPSSALPRTTLHSHLFPAAPAQPHLDLVPPSSSQPAFIDASTNRALTRADLIARSNALAAGLVARSLARPGDVIGIFAPNSLGWIEAFVAGQRLRSPTALFASSL